MPKTKLSYTDRLANNIKNKIDTLIDNYELHDNSWCVYGCDKNAHCDAEKVDTAIRTVDIIRLGGKNLISLIIDMLETSIPGRISIDCAYGCIGGYLDDKQMTIIVDMLTKLEKIVG